MNEEHSRLKVLGAGILSLILTLGIARFSYTPLLPIMQQQAGLGVSEAGWLASINYIGYLCGAIIASLTSDLILKDRLYRLGLIVALVTTVGMGLTENFWIWSLLRFFAGLSSAAGLLLGSGLILNWLIRHDHRSELGIHFSGIGAGIALCAAVVELMRSHLDWSQQWLLLTLLGLFLLVPAWRWLPPPDTGTLTRSGQTMTDNPPTTLFLRLFMAAYFCAGVGYVVSATFIVAIVDQLPGLQGKGAWTFLLLGVAATPACIIWDLIARKTGYLNALIIAFIIQIIGILLPVVKTDLAFSLVGAILFGGTFIGIVSLVLTMAGRYFPTRPAKMMGKMTISYGMAQILAPAITGAIAAYSGDYQSGLYLAAIMMVIGTMILWRLKGQEIT
ncbi:MAG: YbfB/YjiJ family MFS transporter [Candidatus Thiodiazotropha sp. DIVDIV]